MRFYSKFIESSQRHIGTVDRERISAGRRNKKYICSLPVKPERLYKTLPAYAGLASAEFTPGEGRG